MPFSAFNNIAVTGLSTAVPQNIVHLDSFTGLFDVETVEKFKKITGIQRFHKASKMQTASDLGFVAAQRLLEKTQIDTGEIGILVFVTTTPDYRMPATSFVLHKRLKLSKDCIALDVNLGCSGFICGIQVVCSMLECVSARYGLLIVGDTTSKIVSPQDESIAMMFGDGSSATLLEKRNQSEPINIQTKSDGEGYKALIIPAGGYRFQNGSAERRVCDDGYIRSDYDLFMNGTKIFNFTLSEIPRIIKDYLDKKQLHADDFDCFALHQANDFMLKQIVKKLKLPQEKVPVNISKYGNTAGNSIPLLLSDIYASSEERNIRVLACGFGVGLSWGLADFFVNTKNILPIIETDEYYSEGEFTLESYF